MSAPDLDVVQRITRATCAELHAIAVETGHLVQPRRDPSSYKSKLVWPVIYAACSTGLIEVKR